MIIVSIVGPGMKQALTQVHRSEPYADLFEFRLDLIDRPNISRLLSSTRKPTIVTCRPVWEGGNFKGSEHDRIEILEIASALSADYVDLELRTNPRILNEFIQRQPEPRVIVSRHSFDGKPFDVERMYNHLHATGAEVVKLAFLANDVYDCHHAFEFLSLARSNRQKAVAIAMGEAGEPSRILYKKFGGWATYAASEHGSSAAPGQLPASEMKDVYRANRLNSSTRVYGVIGNPLQQSRGVYLHNPLFRRFRKNAVYCKFLVNDLRKFMKHIAPLLNGFSVTIPYKQKVMRHLDQVDTMSRHIGAVNTVIKRNSNLFGTNTDAAAALDAIEKRTKVKGRRLLIVGAGGAARAIAYEAKRRGADVLVTNRTEKKGKTLAVQFGLEHVLLKDVRRTSFDILVNATSVGMTPNVARSPVPRSVLKNKLVFDVVYNPPVTRILSDAKSLGATIVQGTEMYLRQAALQFQLYTGIQPKLEVMKRLLVRKLARKLE